MEPYIKKGDFIPDQLVIRLVKERIQEADAIAKGVLLDGFPRTRHQAQELVASIAVERFLVIQIFDDMCVERILDRRVDPETGEIYHLKYLPPPEYVVNRLVRREYDVDEQVIRNRLRTYHAQLGLILPFFRGKIQVVNGAREVESVFQEMQNCLSVLIQAPAPENTPAPAPAPTQPASAKCAVCMDNPADFLVVPCGHQCGCETCLTAIQNTSGDCPICRKPIAGLVRVYPCGIMEQDNSNVLQLTEVDLTRTEAVADDGGWNEVQDITEPDTISQVSIQIAPCDFSPQAAITPVAVTIQVPDLLDRLPVDICCVVDISGSMGDVAKYQDENDGTQTKNDGLTMLDLVKHAVKTVMHALSPDDRVAIVAFDDIAETVFALGEMTPAIRIKRLLL